MPVETAMGANPKPKPASWDWSYWLALNTQRNPLDPYHEHRHLELKGRLKRPTGLNTDLVEVSPFLRAHHPKKLGCVP
jgi:hypothetical protein